MLALKTNYPNIYETSMFVKNTNTDEYSHAGSIRP